MSNEVHTDIMQRLVAHFASVQARRTMYVSGESYNSLVNYVLGYCAAVRVTTSVDPWELLHGHATDLYGGRGGLHWSTYILDVVAKGDEEHASECVFRVIRGLPSYLAEDPALPQNLWVKAIALQPAGHALPPTV